MSDLGADGDAALASASQRLAGSQARAVIGSLQAHLRSAYLEEGRLRELLVRLQEDGLLPVDIAMLVGMTTADVQTVLHGGSLTPMQG